MEDPMIVPDLALQCVMAYIDDPRDRAAVSLVCHRWYDIDAFTRKHITISFCYTTTPDRLRQRFPHLESLKLKGKPRAAMFRGIIPGDWGGYAGPWIRELAAHFYCIKKLHFRRMIVTDEDLELLATSCGHMLHVLKLDNCSGFSTSGLLHVTRFFRCLKTLFLEGSEIELHDGEWLHELALNNTTLQILNFNWTHLIRISIQDLELIANNCRSLVSLKFPYADEIVDDITIDFFRAATVLEEFSGGSSRMQTDSFRSKQLASFSGVQLPPSLCSLGSSFFLEKHMMEVVFTFANRLKELNLMGTRLNTRDHCRLLRQCPDLEVLEASSMIGDWGLRVLGYCCKKLRRLRIEEGEEGENEGKVTQIGLSVLGRGCVHLEYIAVYVDDIDNACLETIGTCCTKLRDFRLVLRNREAKITDLPLGPLDYGVGELLRRCQDIRRFSLYLRQGGLTDEGLRYVGMYGNNVRWMLLGHVEESDAGLLNFSRGCPKLQKLELRGCCFTEHAVALSLMQLTSLRYLWMQEDEVSLTGQRTDHPATVVPWTQTL